MTELEAGQLVEHMGALWENWKRTDQQVSLWVKLLKPHDYDKALAAVEAAWTCRNYGKPDPSTILGKIREAEPTVEGEDQDAPDPYRFGVFIQCVNPDKSGRGSPGWFVPVIPAPCQHGMSGDRLMAIAQGWTVKHAEMYGGVWEVVIEATPAQMFEKSAGIKAEMRNLEAVG